MDRPEWYGPVLTQPNRGSVAFPQDNSNDSTADVRVKRQLHVCMYVLAVNEQLSAVYYATLLWSHSLPLQGNTRTPCRVCEGTEMEEMEKKSKMSCIGDYMEMGLISDWDITKYQYLVEIRTSFLLNSFHKKDLLRKFLVSELKKMMTMSAIF